MVSSHYLVHLVLVEEHLVLVEEHLALVLPLAVGDHLVHLVLVLAEEPSEYLLALPSRGKPSRTKPMSRERVIVTC